MKSYCLGFAFWVGSAIRGNDEVLLIRKNKPSWQKGKLNGVGGFIEDGESPVEAMVREFKEETNLVTENTDWEERVHLQGIDEDKNKWEVFIFSSSLDFSKAESITDEKLEVVNLSNLSSRKDLMFNLHWIIPFCLDHDQECVEVYQKGMQ